MLFLIKTKKRKKIESKIRFYFPTLSKTYLFFLLQMFVIFYANFGTHKQC